MGQSFSDVALGSTKQKGNVNLFTPEQSSYLSGIIGPTAGQASQAYQQFLQPYSPEGYQDVFQKSVVDPTMQQYQRSILPSIKEAFLGNDESGSSALNRAIAQSATDLGTGLGQQYGQFFQNQQSNQLSALGQLLSSLGIRGFEPVLQQRQGLAGPLLGALGSIGGGALASRY